MKAGTGMDNKEKLCLELARINAVKFGVFTLKSGLKSPVYIDLRLLVSHPDVLRLAGKVIGGLAQSGGLKFERIAGIPYAAIPIATAVSLEFGWPMIYPRKEVKEYGTKKAIEGEYQKGETILVIDDLITTGLSKMEAIAPLEAEGLKVRDIAVLIDRDPRGGGTKELEAKGYALHAALTVNELLEGLKKHGKIEAAQYQQVKAYFKDPEAWQRTVKG